MQDCASAGMSTITHLYDFAVYRDLMSLCLFPQNVR
jgi:hypothetical protein